MSAMDRHSTSLTSALEVSTADLLVRMAGPRGDRARVRAARRAGSVGVDD